MFGRAGLILLSGYITGGHGKLAKCAGLSGEHPELAIGNTILAQPLSSLDLVPRLVLELLGVGQLFQPLPNSLRTGISLTLFGDGRINGCLAIVVAAD